jgi:hypothetical protein
LTTMLLAIWDWDKKKLEKRLKLNKRTLEKKSEILKILIKKMMTKIG